MPKLCIYQLNQSIPSGHPQPRRHTILDLDTDVETVARAPSMCRLTKKRANPLFSLKTSF